jgi:hypothetical protein
VIQATDNGFIDAYEQYDGAGLLATHTWLDSIHRWVPFTSCPPPGTPDVDGRLRAKIKNQTANILQDLAEFKQTRDLFTESARRLHKAFHSLRSGRAFSDFIRILQRPRSVNERALSSEWLKIQYGFRPAFESLHSWADALAFRVRRGIPLTVTAYGESHNTGRTVSTYGHCDAFHTISVRKKATFFVRDSSLKELSRLGISNPASVVWELIPYSFLIDQFVNIGSFISSFDALVGIDDLYVTGTHRTSEEGFSYYNKPVGRNLREALPASYKRTITGRLPGTSSLSLPRLNFKLPGSALGSRFLSALALLHQLRLKR